MLLLKVVSPIVQEQIQLFWQEVMANKHIPKIVVNTSLFILCPLAFAEQNSFHKAF
jgi:hypothetical protein